MSLIIEYSLIIATLLFAFKVVLLFLHKTNRWRLIHFFYFHDQHFIYTDQAKKIAQKRLQNFLSRILLGSICLIFLFFIIYAFNLQL